MNLVSQVINPPMVSGEKKDITPPMVLDTVVTKSHMAQM
jgi:hypothetical protein